MAQIVGIIPARFASKRFPGKMLAALAGKPLVVRTYENSARCHLFDRLIVATDDERIAASLKGAEVILTSPHSPSGTDRVAEAARSLSLDPVSDIIVNIQGDEPCLPLAAIEALIDRMIAEPELPMATAAFPIPSQDDLSDPSLVKCVLDRRSRALYFSRSPLPGAWGHLGIYGYRPDFLQTYASLLHSPLQQAEDLEQLKALEHGYPIAVAQVSQGTLGVNTPQDLEKLERVLCSQNISSSPVA